MNHPYNHPTAMPQTNNRGSNLGWWLASGFMTILLIAGIIILIVLLTGNGKNDDSASDKQDEATQTDEGLATRPEAQPESDANSSPPDTPGNTTPAATQTSSEAHITVREDELPFLPIEQADYVFLDGFHIFPSEREESSDHSGCWTIFYDIAFKGEWNNQNLDNIFDNDSLFATIKSRSIARYPDEAMLAQNYFISMSVFKYNGSEDYSSYLDNTSTDNSEIYLRDDCFLV